MWTYPTMALAWSTTALLFCLFSPADAGFMRLDVQKRDGIPVGQLLSSDVKDAYGHYVMDPAPGSQGVRFPFSCANYIPAKEFSENGVRYVACCRQDQNICGTTKIKMLCCDKGTGITGVQETGFACCAPGRWPKGNVAKGDFACCLSNEEYVDKACRPAPAPPRSSASVVPAPAVPASAAPASAAPVSAAPASAAPASAASPSTMSAVTGADPVVKDRLQYPLGTTSNATGQSTTHLCSSGVTTGKNYQIINQDGRYWGYTHDSDCYSTGQADQVSSNFKIGTFKFCMDEPCTQNLSIDPGDGFSMKDIHGILPEDTEADTWLHNYVGGNQLTQTNKYPEAGVFSITKWPGGKYCLGGAGPNGASYIHPTEHAGIAFAGGDSQSCLEVQLKEVPTNVRDRANNCLW